MRRNKILLAISVSVVVAAAIVACGGNTDLPVFSATVTQATVVQGAVVKGPVFGSKVCAYSLAGGTKGALIGSCVTTDGKGAYSFSLPAGSGEVLLESTGGNYIDEITAVRTTVDASSTFTAIASGTGGTISAVLTPLTTLAVNSARSAGTLNQAGFKTQAANVLAALGLDPAIDIARATPVVEGTTNSYGRALIAFSQLLATQPTSGTSTLASILATDKPMLLQSAYKAALNSLPTITSTFATAPFTVKLIGFNDYHGNLESPGTFGQNSSVPSASRPAVGGAEFMAGYVASLKKQNPLNVVVGAGDFIGASPLISSLFFDEPAIETLNRIGLEFNAVGNHEFDKGSAELLRLQKGGCKVTGGAVDPNSCKGSVVGTPATFEGAKFKWLSANVVSTATGRTLLPAYGVKTFNGVKVAFIGMTLKDTPSIVTPTGVAGLEFRDEAQTVNALIPELRAQGIESIVVLVHQGGFQSSGPQDINTCDGSLSGSPIATIVSQLDNAVDLVISGHTHAAYNCMLPNAAGRNISVTSSSAFGRVLTDVDLTIDPTTRDVTRAVATNRLVDRTSTTVTADSVVAAIVNAYKSLVSPIANVVLGAITTDLPTSRDAACNTPAGELIADSQLTATQPSAFGGAVMAFMNNGGVRAPLTFASSSAGEGNGNVTYGEAFTVQPFGNSLVTMSLTQQNIKDFLEEQFAGCLGQSNTATRFAIPSAGVKYTWDGSKACGARINTVTLTSAGTTETLVSGGVLQSPTKIYRVTVNNFMADGGDGYSTLVKGTNRLGGAQDIDALSAYLSGFKAPKAAYAPGSNIADSGTVRISRMGAVSATPSCPSGTNLNP